MIDSGDTVAFGDLTARRVDKHSTGGVADGVTLVFAPLARRARPRGREALRPRARAHGRDARQARVDPGPAHGPRARRSSSAQVERIGCAVAAQSADLVPADGALYALRDATATVAVDPADRGERDVEEARRRHRPDPARREGGVRRVHEDARGTREELARACLALARGWGRARVAAVTDMSQPLGDAIGNALDVAEAVDVLRGERPRAAARPHGPVRRATPWRHGSRTSRADAARSSARSARSTTGRRSSAFRRMVEAQGGDPRVADDPRAVLPARARRSSRSRPTGPASLAAVDAEAIGRASGALGAGRVPQGRPDRPRGRYRGPRRRSATALDGGRADRRGARARPRGRARSRAAVLEALTLADGPVAPPPLVYDGPGVGERMLGVFTALGSRYAVYLARRSRRSA